MTTTFGFHLPGPAGLPGTLTCEDGDPAELLPAAAVAFARAEAATLVVEDAMAFARAVATAEPSAVTVLCDLASRDRLVCLTAANSALSLAGVAPGWDATNLIAAGRAAIEQLAATATRFGVAPGTVAKFGPLGVFVRTRGAVALGVAAGNGLRVDPRLRDGSVGRLRGIADDAFARLTRHPDAAAMFQGGRRATPDHKGFRPMGTGEERAGRQQVWLRGQFTDVEDRLGMPVPLAEGRIEPNSRNWPVWLVGTAPLTAYADLQAAEHLAHALGRGDRVHPSYHLQSGLGSAGPGWVAYRRFRDLDKIPPCFVPSPGHTFLRLRYDDLKLAALAVKYGTPGGGGLLDGLEAGGGAARFLARAVATSPSAPSLTEPQAVLLATLIATGAGDATVASVFGWATGVPVTAGAIADVAGALSAAVPELAGHLRDTTLTALARHYEATEAELAGWIGFAGSSGGTSAVRRLIDSGFADRVGTVTIRQALLQKLGTVRRNGFRAESGSVAVSHRRHVADALARVLAEAVTTRTGRVFANLTWPAARAAALTVAEDLVLDAAFALVASGARVVAITPAEILSEIPAGGDVGWLTGVATRAVQRCSGISYSPDHGPVECW